MYHIPKEFLREYTRESSIGGDFLITRKWKNFMDLEIFILVLLTEEMKKYTVKQQAFLIMLQTF